VNWDDIIIDASASDSRGGESVRGPERRAAPDRTTIDGAF
jgi:hypothetical protein